MVPRVLAISSLNITSDHCPYLLLPPPYFLVLKPVTTISLQPLGYCHKTILLREHRKSRWQRLTPHDALVKFHCPEFLGHACSRLPSRASSDVSHDNVTPEPTDNKHAHHAFTCTSGQPLIIPVLPPSCPISSITPSVSVLFHHRDARHPRATRPSIGGSIQTYYLRQTPR